MGKRVFVKNPIAHILLATRSRKCCRGTPYTACGFSLTRSMGVCSQSANVPFFFLLLAFSCDRVRSGGGALIYPSSNPTISRVDNGVAVILKVKGRGGVAPVPYCITSDQEGIMAKKKRAKKKYVAKQEDDVVMWVRLPRPASVKDLKKMGVKAAACYGGDTCIAATSIDSEAGVVLQGPIGHLLKHTDLLREDPCFGGNTCIV